MDGDPAGSQFGLSYPTGILSCQALWLPLLFNLFSSTQAQDSPILAVVVRDLSPEVRRHL